MSWPGHPWQTMAERPASDENKTTTGKSIKLEHKLLSSWFIRLRYIWISLHVYSSCGHGVILLLI